jgi:hypothetical protein
MPQFIESAVFSLKCRGAAAGFGQAENGMLVSQIEGMPARRALGLSALLVLGASLAACSGATVADHLSPATGGLPQNAPPRPSTAAEYPAVHDMPPPRSSSLLTEEEQKKLEDELIAARKRAAAGAKPAGSARGK